MTRLDSLPGSRADGKGKWKWKGLVQSINVIYYVLLNLLESVPNRCCSIVDQEETNQSDHI